MTNRERALAILRYQPYDRMPVVDFGWWHETKDKWIAEGHLREEDSYRAIQDKLGFDFDWGRAMGPATALFPVFERKVLEVQPDGFIRAMGQDGVVTLTKPGLQGIPIDVDYTLKTRGDWENLYKPRLLFSPERAGDLTKLMDADRENPLGLNCGSLYGRMRNWLTVTGVSYLYADDEELYTEIIDTVADLCYQCVKFALEAGCKPDYGHFWEDICFKTGPLVAPSVFRDKVGPHYLRITKLLAEYGVDIVSLDCDGCIDALIPTWLDNGVNTMFPIEVGTWEASIDKWRPSFGKKLLGVGGMNKTVFAYDYAAVDAEIERLKPLVAGGGFIPCPDHRIAPDAKWENVQYYCDRMRRVFG
jgi:uroporphyrinogen decarboxylase